MQYVATIIIGLIVAYVVGSYTADGINTAFHNATQTIARTP